MAELWFISDLHLGHQNILKFEAEARPFETLDEMHYTMMRRWNSVVRPGDRVMVLGDVVWRKDYLFWLDKMNGEKELVMGNHDKFESKAYLQYFRKLHGAKYWEEAILTHLPIHPSHFRHRMCVNVHGHLHSGLVKEQVFGKETLSEYPVDRRYVNVSCEQNNLYPIHADEIRDRIKEVKNEISSS